MDSWTLWGGKERRLTEFLQKPICQGEGVATMVIVVNICLNVNMFFQNFCAYIFIVVVEDDLNCEGDFSFQIIHLVNVIDDARPFPCSKTLETIQICDDFFFSILEYRFQN